MVLKPYPNKVGVRKWWYISLTSSRKKTNEKKYMLLFKNQIYIPKSLQT